MTALKYVCKGVFALYCIKKNDFNVKHCYKRLLNKGLIFIYLHPRHFLHVLMVTLIMKPD